MSDPSKHLGVWPAGLHNLPSNEIGAWAEQHEDVTVAWCGRPLANVHAPSMAGARHECGRRRAEDGRAGRSEPSRFLATCHVRVDAAGGDGARQGRLDGRLDGSVRNLDRPDCTIDSGQLFRRRDLFVANELGPRSGGSVGEILHRSVVGCVPSGRRLIGSLPEERTP
jgi:hypothetical protein